MPEVASAVLAEEQNSLVATDATTENGSLSATTDVEDTSSQPKRGGPRNADRIANLEKTIESLRDEMARRDDTSSKALSEATQAINALIAKEQQAQSQQTLNQTFRQIDLEAKQRAERYGWDDYQTAEWAEERKQVAKDRAEVEADKQTTKAQREQSKITEAQAHAIKSRPTEINQLASRLTKSFASDNEMDAADFKLDVAQVMVALKKDPWEPGAVEEAQDVIYGLLNKQRRDIEKAERNGVLDQRAKNGTDVMPQGGGGPSDWRGAVQARKTGQITTGEFIRRMQSAPADERQKYNIY